jgi:peptide/nickel transport system substrate-binding protein
VTAVAGEADASVINDHVGFFAPGSVYASDVGMENLPSKIDFAALRKEGRAAGYGGEKVVFLGAADVPRITAIAQVGADTLSKIGSNVDYVSLDWGTIVQRDQRQQPVAEGRSGRYRATSGRLRCGQATSVVSYSISRTYKRNSAFWVLRTMPS